MTLVEITESTSNSVVVTSYTTVIEITDTSSTSNTVIVQDGIGTGDMLKSIYDTDEDGTVNSADTAAALTGDQATEITANTAARHVAVTVADSSEINFTLTGQEITASIITGSIDILKLDAGLQTTLGYIDQDVKTTSAPVFNGLRSTGATYFDNTLTIPVKFRRNTGDSEMLALAIQDNNAEFRLTQDADENSAHYILFDVNSASTGAAGTRFEANSTLLGTITDQGIDFYKEVDMNAQNIVNPGTVDGRDVATDGSKLDTIENGADVTDATNVSAAGAPIISSGSGVPSSTPGKMGDIYIDTTGLYIYIATGNSSSTDWKQVMST